MNGEKIYINVPFREKDEAKSLGARWDFVKRTWYYYGRDNSAKFSKWPEIIMEKEMKVNLSTEQREFIEYVKLGRNVLVDACIGSGKTTAIQALCDELTDKRILYLTYNTLLKLDARKKIKDPNVLVTNYHGFAYKVLNDAGIKCGVSDLIQEFLKLKDTINIPTFNILVLDEYQDIEQEIADMLNAIKKANPGLQIVAVGDMKQKIYDKTTLDVPDFIDEFLEDFVTVNFTRCFRLSKSIAAMLGFVWGKEIIGVNETCELEYMNLDEVTNFLSVQDTKDILCLGSRTGKMSYVLNKLETNYPAKFNKKTVYASIKDEDRGEMDRNLNAAIFTTYDSSKGLERKCCVIFDFTESYWNIRLNVGDTKYEILRNIFCVAASRGKEKIIIVRSNETEKNLTMQRLAMPVNNKNDYAQPFVVSEMYSFKYKEDVEACYKMLDISEIKHEDNVILDIKSTDDLIDLSPCIGILQEAKFFNNYDIDGEILFAISNQKTERKQKLKVNSEATLEEKVLFLTALETSYNRYVQQVKTPFVSEEELDAIANRLSTIFTPDEEVQCEYEMEFDFYDKNKHPNPIVIRGRDDVEKDGIVYELKFVSELNHEHFLQCAFYSLMKGCSQSIIWNVKNNKMYKIVVKSKRKFLEATINTITKGDVKAQDLIINLPWPLN